MNHSFNVSIANECGVSAAIMLQNFYFWIQLNRETGRNEIEGRTWMFSTQASLKEMMPYLSTRQIRLGIQKLKSAEYLDTGNYNRRGMDRTIWYTLTDKALKLLEPDEDTTICQNEKMHLSKCNNAFVKSDKSICQNEQIHLSKRENAFVKMGEAIPDIIHKISNKDIKQDTKHKIIKKKYAEFVTLTDKEYQELVSEYGKNMTDECIRILDNYKGSKGKKYVSDYRAILSWVIRKFYEDNPQMKPRNVVADVAEQAKRIIEGGLTHGRQQDDTSNLFNDDCIRTTAEPV